MNTTTDQQLPRYRGLCGAIVTIREHSRKDYSGRVDRGYAWDCECGESGSDEKWSIGYQPPGSLQSVREAANKHASTCRALPASATK